ncbi:hypothetical protein LGT41_0010550 [Abyssibius alkaniclasticus]|nr:hypothetical protein [Abyssibius alkaniclasticus]UPH72868.1 hypothetical protein LGT41_0010550 [Abyssibius alkaniclasticus]
MCIVNGGHRVFTRTKALGLCHVQNNLYALGQAPRSFVLFCPDRGKAHQHFWLFNAINWHASNLVKGIIAQGVDPLLPVLGVFPGRHAVDMHLLGNFRESWYLARCIEPWVQTLLGHAPILKRAFAGLVQGHHIGTTQAKIGA